MDEEKSKDIYQRQGKQLQIQEEFGNTLRALMRLNSDRVIES